MLKIKKNQKKSGFSIGEVLISVFLISIALTTIMTMYNAGVKEIIDERDSVIASLLAQEGVELIRNIRDNNWANGDSSFLDIDDSTAGCRIDVGSINICEDSPPDYLLSYSGSFYVHDSSGSATRFSRKVIINTIASSPDEKEILSIVTWDYSGDTPSDKADCTVGEKCVFSEATLTEWGNDSLP